MTSAAASVRWTDEQYASLESIVRMRAGLVFHTLRRASVEAGAARVMRRVGVTSIDMLLSLVGQDGAVFDDLMAEITIGETYFFRDPKQFTTLRDSIIPEWRSRHDGERPFRAWSAACSTGEEAYSLAVALQEEHVSGVVVGTDIARARLIAARRGRYRRWSFRGVGEATIDRYFRREGDLLVLVPEVRRDVEFRYLNLASDCYPAMSAGVWGMDVVFCRNVLIYFDRDTIARVAERLLATIVEDGWIVLGASDPPLSDYVPCDVVQTPAGLAYRRPGAAARFGRGDAGGDSEGARVVTVLSTGSPPAPAPLAAQPPPTAPHLKSPTALPAASASAPGEPSPATELVPAPARNGMAPASAEAAREDADALATRVRQLANAGRLDAAGRECIAALERFRDHPELHYLHAVLVAESGRFAEAARAARRAVYLDRSMIVGHLALATALLKGGDRPAARRSFSTAARLLGAMPPTAIVAYSDGEPAGRLLEMTRMQERMTRSDNAA